MAMPLGQRPIVTISFQFGIIGVSPEFFLYVFPFLSCFLFYFIYSKPCELSWAGGPLGLTLGPFPVTQIYFWT